MATNKTVATDASVDDYLDAIADNARKADCAELVRLMAAVTKQQPMMWGPGIVGFGSFHYRYPSGREGDICLTGFASRSRDIAIYLMANGKNQQALLSRLGRHKMGKTCLSIRRLTDVDQQVLRELVVESVAEVRRRQAD